MNKSLIFLSLSLSALAALPAFAVNEAPADPYTLISRQLVSANPSVMAQRCEAEAELLELKSSNNLSDPEISVAQLWGDQGAGKKLDVGISQSFDWPGAYRARRRAINAATKATTLLDLSNYADRMIEAKQLLIDLSYHIQHISTLSSMLKGMDDLYEVIREGYRQGEQTLLDLKRLEIERVSMRARYSNCLSDIASARAAIRSFAPDIDLASIEPLIRQFPEEKLLSEADYEAQVDEFDPMVRYYNALTEEVRHKGEADRLAASFPGFSLGYDFQREAGVNFHGFTASLSLPFFSRRNVKASATATSLATSYQRDAARLERVMAMRSAYAAGKNLTEQAAEYNEVIHQSPTYADLLKKALDGGQIDAQHYLQELDFYLSFIEESLEVNYNRAKVMADLNRYSLD